MKAEDTSQVPVTHYHRTRSAPESGTRMIVREGALGITVDGRDTYSIMRTPGHDRELAIGFLFAEGIIERVSDIGVLMECPDAADSILVRRVTGGGEVPAAPRNLVVSSSCGLCGRQGLEALIARLTPVGTGLTVGVDVLYAVPAAVRRRQALFEATGGTHAMALFDHQGTVVAVREDVGRHNALDKLVGHGLLAGLRLSEMGVFLSGRASLEMVVKAVRAGITLIAAVSAPTEAAVAAANRLGVTLCGFVRGDEVCVYTHPRRVRPEAAPASP